MAPTAKVRLQGLLSYAWGLLCRVALHQASAHLTGVPFVAHRRAGYPLAVWSV